MVRGSGILFLLSMLGCGASPRMLHQSEVYFERCHAADLDTRRSNEDRLTCWSAWLEHYRDGVTAGRARHAERRVDALRTGSEVPAPLPDDHAAYTVAIFALSSGGTEPSAEAPDTTEPPTTTDAAASGPSDAVATTRGAPEVPGAPEVDVVVPSPSEPTVASEPSPTERARLPPPRTRARPRVISPPRMASPSHPCNSVCDPAWTRCLDRSSDRATEQLEACRAEYRVCMRGCL